MGFTFTSIGGGTVFSLHNYCGMEPNVLKVKSCEVVQLVMPTQQLCDTFERDLRLFLQQNPVQSSAIQSKSTQLVNLHLFTDGRIFLTRSIIPKGKSYEISNVGVQKVEKSTY